MFIRTGLRGPLAFAVVLSLILFAATGCGAGGSSSEPSAAQATAESNATATATPPAEDLGFDPANLPGAAEIAAVPVPPSADGVPCGAPEVSPPDDDSQEGLIAAARADCDSRYDSILVLEFGSAEAATGWATNHIRQEDRIFVDTSELTATTPKSTKCIHQQEEGDERGPFETCLLQAGRFLIGSSGDEGVENGGQEGIVRARAWAAAAGRG